ncbi:MAG: CDP-diacylglycerol--glycerol-3-phosphate 3-phosphatidyltransferase [Chloroflexi bacterium]|nr:MAG: CDP-diacylglycerol--glycerol-3-phosphate 3-phosphatidyltransferase [Chloroflexota bacterium]
MRSAGASTRPDARTRARTDAREARITTLPNVLGLARIALTPVVMALILLPFPGGALLAAGVFAIAAVTDVLDGRIARARGQVTSLGVFMDLTADKVLVAGVMIAMVEVGLLPSWIAATILGRELVIGGIRQLAASESVVIAARALGKAKTAATLLGVFVLLLTRDAQTAGPLAGSRAQGLLGTAGFWLMVAATALAIVSAVDYLRGSLPMLLGAAPPAPDERPPT